MKCLCTGLFVTPPRLAADSVVVVPGPETFVGVFWIAGEPNMKTLFRQIPIHPQIAKNSMLIHLFEITLVKWMMIEETKEFNTIILYFRYINN